MKIGALASVLSLAFVTIFVSSFFMTGINQECIDNMGFGCEAEFAMRVNSQGIEVGPQVRKLEGPNNYAEPIFRFMLGIDKNGVNTYFVFPDVDYGFAKSEGFFLATQPTEALYSDGNQFSRIKYVGDFNLDMMGRIIAVRFLAMLLVYIVIFGGFVFCLLNGYLVFEYFDMKIHPQLVRVS